MIKKQSYNNKKELQNIFQRFRNNGITKRHYEERHYEELAT